MLFAKNTVDKQDISAMEAEITAKDATLSVFAALKPKTRIKVSPAMYMEVGDPYHIEFGDSMYVPKNSIELFALRSRQRLYKDVVELKQEVLVEALDILKDSKPIQTKKKKGGKR